jgi:hypothetical protein
VFDGLDLNGELDDDDETLGREPSYSRDPGLSRRFRAFTTATTYLHVCGMRTERISSGGCLLGAFIVCLSVCITRPSGIVKSAADATKGERQE